MESFRYLSYCTTKYGPERMTKHAQSLWACVKDAIYISPQSTLLSESECLDGMNFQASDVMLQAFVLLQKIILQEGGFISLIMGDNDINTFVNSLNGHKDFDDIPVQNKQRLHGIGHILSICAKTSVAACSKIFEGFFPHLMDVLGLSVAKLPDSGCHDKDPLSPLSNFGALFLCIEILAAFRHLVVSHDNFMMIPDFAHQTCYVMLSKYSKLLMEAFISTLKSITAGNTQRAYGYYAGLCPFYNSISLK